MFPQTVEELREFIAQTVAESMPTPLPQTTTADARDARAIATQALSLQREREREREISKRRLTRLKNICNCA